VKVAEIPQENVKTGKPDRRAPAPNTCGGCDAVWTATLAAHCAAPGCHRTFASVGLFDSHRSARGPHGACIDPETIRHGKTGERLMFHRNGMWRGPEMTEEAKAKAFGGSAA
jgi:hypothetical protein